MTDHPDTRPGLDALLWDDIIKFVRWSANVRDDRADAIDVARALLGRIEALGSPTSTVVPPDGRPGNRTTPDGTPSATSEDRTGLSLESSPSALAAASPSEGQPQG